MAAILVPAAAATSSAGGQPARAELLTELLRLATRCALAAASAGVKELSDHDYVRASVLVGKFSRGDEALHLWSRPGTARSMTQMLAVVLRRAAETGRMTPELEVVLRILESYGEAVDALLQPSDQARGATLSPHVYARGAQLRATALALVRSGTLHCLSRILDACKSEPSNRTCLAPLFSRVASQLLKVVLLLRLPAAVEHLEVLGALADSRLLDHVSRALCGPVCEADGEIAIPPRGMGYACSMLLVVVILGQKDWQPLLHSLPLPGPEFHHMLTAMAVEVLHRLDGGTRYGLPPTAVPWLGSLDEDSFYHPSMVLLTWTQLVDLGCGPTWRQGFLGPAAVYTLGLRAARVCTSVVRSLDCGGEEPAGATGSGSSGGNGGEGCGGSAGGSSAGGGLVVPASVRRRDYCTAGLRAALAAHSALQEGWQRRQLRRAAGGVAGPGPAVAVVAADAKSAEEEDDKEEPAAATGSATRAPTPTPAAELDPEPPPPVAPAGQAASAAAWGGGCMARPPEWWQAAVDVMNSALAPEGLAGLGALVKRLLELQLKEGQLAQPLPGVLPSSPPPDLAGLLDAGFIPLLERVVRCTERGGASQVGETQALWKAACLCWPRLAWLTAYTQPHEAAALVVTLWKASAADVSACQRSLLQGSYLLCLLQGLMWAAGEGCGSAPRDAATNTAAGGTGRNACRHATSCGGSGGSGGHMVAVGQDDSTSRLLLLRLLSLMIDRGLGGLCANMRQVLVDARESGLIHEDAASDKAGVLLALLSCVVDQAAAAQCDGAEGDGAGAEPQPPGPSDAAAWRELLEEAGAPDTVGRVAEALDAGILPGSAMLGRLLRVLFGLLVLCPDGMRTMLCGGGDGEGAGSSSGSGGGKGRAKGGGGNKVTGGGKGGGGVNGTPAFRALERLLSPGGCMPDVELLRLLRAVVSGGHHEGLVPTASELSADSPWPRLPPLSSARSLLRICAHRGCLNMAGDSEAELVPQEQPGSGGSSGPGGSDVTRGSASAGRAEAGTARYCSMVCREAAKRARRGAQENQAQGHQASAAEMRPQGQRGGQARRQGGRR